MLTATRPDAQCETDAAAAIARLATLLPPTQVDLVDEVMAPGLAPGTSTAGLAAVRAGL